MSIQQIQQQLIDNISIIKDENILKMLDEEVAYYLHNKEDLSKLLSEEDHKELVMLANEPIDKNTMSLNEFNTIMDEWNMK